MWSSPAKMWILFDRQLMRYNFAAKSF